MSMQIIIKKTFVFVAFVVGLIGLTGYKLFYDKLISQLATMTIESVGVFYIIIIIPMLLVNIFLYILKPVDISDKKRELLKSCNKVIAFFIFMLIIQIMNVLFLTIMRMDFLRNDYLCTLVFYFSMLVFAGIVGYIKFK